MLKSHSCAKGAAGLLRVGDDRRVPISKTIKISTVINKTRRAASFVPWSCGFFLSPGVQMKKSSVHTLCVMHTRSRSGDRRKCQKQILLSSPPTRVRNKFDHTSGRWFSLVVHEYISLSETSTCRRHHEEDKRIKVSRTFLF